MNFLVTMVNLAEYTSHGEEPIYITILILSGMAFGFAFWLWMLIDCCRKTFDDNDKNIWVLGMIVAGIAGALVYFFLGRSKGRRKEDV